MTEDKQSETKEKLLLQAVKTQRSILQLLDHTLYDTYQSEKNRPIEEQNEDLLHLAHRVRTIIGKKPKLKEVYRKLQEEHELDL
ncbi:hypothetical protein BN1058_02289 [Paraliobacillus sp. PM-2]|uniref:hypothetical protein n=1 Tax=Paraliobacillus sp. PM-2 TaxID=1462524 RepID=UPI00061C51F5|nr:hypothetical protein [Paraliobacillus sp. PM-2]CQR47954.1 hypothetical protein BN1058_02289 [Paraliobacillus sp. PM-2]